jgi:hypothetical protein
LELGTDLVQIAGAAFHAVGIRGEERGQVRQVVLEVVDRGRGIVRRGPRQRGAAGLERALDDPLRGRNASFDRADHVEDVERRHARPRFVQLDARE